MVLGGDAWDIEQFHVAHGDQVYEVTFSLSPSLSSGQQQAVTRTTLGSWSWTD